MQCKYLCAPLLLASAAGMQVAASAAPTTPSPPLPLAQRAEHALPPRSATFSALTIAGVRLGSRVVAKSGGGKLAAPGVFSRHGNPSAVVVPGLLGGKDGPSAQKPGKLPRQAPAEVPGWVSSVAVKLDKNHAQWLYKRLSYAMGFVVDRQGVVDAVTVAGTDKSVTLEAEGISGSIALGDDMRKVLGLFGYPDTIESHGGDAKAKMPRAFELRYNRVGARAEPPAALVFTIRDNRVVRFYAFKK